MALVTFVDDQAPYLNAQNLNNNFNECKEIVDSGTITDTNKVDNYIKYKNGTMICWGTHIIGATSTNGQQDGALYYYDFGLIRNFAKEFISKPHLTLNVYTSSGQTQHYLLTAQKYNTATTTGYGTFRIYSPTNTTFNFTIEYFAIGKWQ